MFNKLFVEVIKRIERLRFKNNTIFETMIMIIVGIVEVSIILGFIFGFIYCIYYGITWIMFWLFGPTIFGITMSWKAPLMLWFVVSIARSIFGGR